MSKRDNTSSRAALSAPDTAPNPEAAPLLAPAPITAPTTELGDDAVISSGPANTAPDQPASPAPSTTPASSTAAAATIPPGYMADARGRLVPATMVRPEELLEDGVVRAQFARAVEASEGLRAFRDEALAEIGAFLDLLADRYKAPRGGAKGNVTLATYDGLLRIQLAVSDQLTFGPELQVAKTLVDECIRAWSAGADDKLCAIVNDAFAVDKQGKLNVGRILELRRLNIDDEAWKRAMGAIGDAIRVAQSKQYIRFYRRDKPDARMEQVPLDLASV